jgi:hypothetical protein
MIAGSPIAQTSSSNVPFASLGSFQGAGTTNVAYLVGGNVTSSGPGGLIFTGSDRLFAGTATVDYTYTPAAVVPLPAAAWMGLSLLGGLGVVRKLRMRRR